MYLQHNTTRHDTTNLNSSSQISEAKVDQSSPTVQVTKIHTQIKKQTPNNASNHNPIILFCSVMFCSIYLFTGLLHLPRQDELVQQRVHLVEVKHNVQLAHIAEVLIQQLHEKVDGLHEQ